MSTNIRILEVIGSPHAVSSADGSKVHDLVAEALRSDEAVELSFTDIEDITSAFLNAAIGQLYGEFTDELIRENLRVIDTEADHLILLKRVVDRAKEFFTNPDAYDAALSEAFNE